ncbi:MAG TPA: efflux RND transporter permease subunit [Longimicrobiales bacterium]|nr:efflux RND transporter permease subunit [Longimicrobiales bacterium]
MRNDERITDRWPGAIAALIRFVLEQRLVVAIGTVALVLAGVAMAPFDWDTDWLPRSPVAVDALPDLSENQQIVFTDWMGRSPRDVEDQITYPLTVQLMGLPGVRDVRSTSMFGFSTISVIFHDDVDFYWARSRIIEKLNSLPPGTLPAGVQPGLGPDATGLGQVYWYTLEGQDPRGRPVGGWDLHELRSVQDYYVRYGLLAAEGISEVASIGGFVREYQVDVDPDAARAAGVSIEQVFAAVQNSNLDIGARTTEVNRVEYVIRGTGFVRNTADIEAAVVRAGDGFTPIRVADVATVSLGPAERRGALDRGGAEAVGGVVVVRDGYNPLEAISNVKGKVAELEAGMPIRAVVDWPRTTLNEVSAFAGSRGFNAFTDAALDQEAWLTWLRSTPVAEWPEWVTTSQLAVVPFYDRTGLIHETLGTLNDALLQQILVTMIVVIIMLMHLRTALLVSAMLPLAVLMAFIAMKQFGVDANVVALAGIAIAIGTIVDMGIIISENVMRHLDAAGPGESRINVVYRGASEVGSAVLTAIATTVISFLPVFAMTGAEGKLFTPLAFTKTFVLLAAVIIALTVVPVVLYLAVARRQGGEPGLLRRIWTERRVLAATAIIGTAAFAASVLTGWIVAAGAAAALALLALYRLYGGRLPAAWRGRDAAVGSLATAFAVVWWLAYAWQPLGAQRPFAANLLFVGLLVGGLLGIFLIFERRYEGILRWALANRRQFLAIPVVMVLLSLNVWLGFDRMFGFVPRAAAVVGVEAGSVRSFGPYSWAMHTFPGLGREFMPALDEGSFLWMPTLMPHASMGEALEVMALQNAAFEGIPEVESVVGKIGRAESALDPAPISMFETVINYRPEYATDAAGRRIRFAYDRRTGEFVRNADGDLVPDRRGRPYRQWREHVRSPQDIWDAIVEVGRMPGVTSAPRLQPIETRLVMLQTGMRASMGIKVQGPDLLSIERAAVQLEAALRQVPAVVAATVNAERVVGKPYLEIEIDREAAARYGLNVVDVQNTIAMAVGGMEATTTVEGRERYNVRVRYPRELRADPDQIGRILVTAGGAVGMGSGTAAGSSGMGAGSARLVAAPSRPTQVPLSEVTRIHYVRGPEMIRSENTFPVAYVTFGGQAGVAEVEVVEQVRSYLIDQARSGGLNLPAGVSYTFSGSYENQVHATRTLRVVLPIALAIIFLILYFQFRDVPRTLIVFSGIAVAWAGAFIMIWLYGQAWFGDFALFGTNMRDLFQLQAINLSVAVWVGFLALFGIASDDGVVIMTYLQQSTDERAPSTAAEVREATVQAGLRRVRPLLMTSATTILALLPVLTATGRGADIMIPMAIPTVGGMSFVLLTMFTVPVLFAWNEERRLTRTARPA